LLVDPAFFKARPNEPPISPTPTIPTVGKIEAVKEVFKAGLSVVY
jgi:hypothetical protein